jgi:hypothetical protein
MSKAFTKESDEDDEELQLPALPAGGKNYITPIGYACLRGELLDLMDNERPKVVEIVHWAASKWGSFRKRRLLVREKAFARDRPPDSLLDQTHRSC